MRSIAAQILVALVVANCCVIHVQTIRLFVNHEVGKVADGAIESAVYNYNQQLPHDALKSSLVFGEPKCDVNCDVASANATATVYLSQSSVCSENFSENVASVKLVRSEAQLHTSALNVLLPDLILSKSLPDFARELRLNCCLTVLVDNTFGECKLVQAFHF